MSAGKNRPEIFVNQKGYIPGRKKSAVIPFPAESFELLSADGSVVYIGKTTYFGFDEASGDEVYTADFSVFDRTGKYRVHAGNGYSAEFEISEDIYTDVCRDTLKAFYYLRCGCSLDQAHAGVYEHAPCHTAPAVLWENHSIQKEVTGGWHDAGDYGRYVTAGAAALAHLLYAYKMFPEAFEQLKTNIPSDSGLPDLLAECKVELLWIMKMQQDDGGVYHKATTKGHAPFIMPEEDTAQMYLLPVSSSATADTAAVCALAAGIYRSFDTPLADQLQACAELAYNWLEKHPDFLFINPKECTTGGYGEQDDTDNRCWAAAELYALTGAEKYHRDFHRLSRHEFSKTALGYGETGGFASLAYLLSQCPDKSIETSELLKKAFLDRAIRLSEQSGRCGYKTAISLREYCWGSNMNVLKAGMTFIIAAKLCGREEFSDYALAQMDYILGKNAMGISYISGIGEYSVNYPHYRPAAADNVEKCPGGMVSGGPNRHPCDAAAIRLIPEGTPPMKCFADDTACYSLNEITIYWNSPAVFVSGYFTSHTQS